MDVPQPSPHIGHEQLELAARNELVDTEALERIESDPELRAVVDRIRADNALLTELVHATHQRPTTQPTINSPDAVPGYTITRELARGAQGVVYEAQQDHTNRRVALKTLIQGSFATSRQRDRFEREVELVAAMRHPGIVTIYESDMTPAGQMYVAMEFVEGQTLDAWARGSSEQRLTTHHLRRAVTLLSGISDAINFAHQRGVMHRDIKPGNILVDDADAPHVLDFGLAKNVGDPDGRHDAVTTRVGEFLGTFAYAAPEQFHGDPNAIDIRTDVYALGAVLYELLTGHLPHSLDGDWGDVFERLTTAEPIAPARLNSALDNDLDTIVRTAMALEPERRYQSAGALRDDLDRWLDGRPIDARRDSTVYVLQKNIRRHIVPITVIAFISAVVLIGGPWSYFTLQARNTQRAFYATTGNSFIEAIEQTNWAETDDQVRIKSYLGNVAARAEGNLPDDPDFQARFWSALGHANLGLPPFDAAEEQLERSLSIQRSIADEPSAILAQRIFDVARVHWKQARYEDARGLYLEALAMQQSVLGEEHPDVAHTISHIAACLRGQGRAREAEPMYRRALTMREDLPEPNPGDIINSRNSLALCLLDLGRHDDAARAYEQLLTEFQQHFPDWERNWRYARVLNNYGRCQIELGRPVAAIATLLKALEIKTYYHENEAHTDVAKSQIELAEALLLTGALDEADTVVRTALSTVRAAYSAPHEDVARAYTVQGRILRARNRVGEAQESFQSALEMYTKTRPSDHWVFADLRSDLAQCALDTGDLDRAEELLHGTEATMRAMRSGYDRRLIVLLERHLELLRAKGESAAASVMQRALEDARQQRSSRNIPPDR